MNMAGKTSMTAEAAAAAIADVKGYRQGLTARAAAIVWIVWAMAMATVAMGEVIFAPDFAAEAPEEEGANYGFDAGGVLPLLMIIGAIVATNAVWRAHAIERDTSHKSWVAWAATLGVVALFTIIGVATINIIVRTTSPEDIIENPGTTYVFMSPIFTASIALAITLLQRKRVRMLPGLLLAGALLLTIAVAPLLASGTLEEKMVQVGFAHTFVAFGGALGIGLWHFYRG